MLSDQIRKYRKEKGLSQDELAEKLGVSRQSISLWENGQTQPTIENILALARIFNVSTDAILGNTEEVKSQAEEAATEEVVLGASEGKRRSGMWIIIVGAATVAILAGGGAALDGDRKTALRSPGRERHDRSGGAIRACIGAIRVFTGGDAFPKCGSRIELQ